MAYKKSKSISISFPWAKEKNTIKYIFLAIILITVFGVVYAVEKKRTDRSLASEGICARKGPGSICEVEPNNTIANLATSSQTVVTPEGLSLKHLGWIQDGDIDYWKVTVSGFGGKKIGFLFVKDDNDGSIGGKNKDRIKVTDTDLKKIDMSLIQVVNTNEVQVGERLGKIDEEDRNSNKWVFTVPANDQGVYYIKLRVLDGESIAQPKRYQMVVKDKTQNW